MTQKQVLMTRTPGETHWVGDGFPVRTAFHFRDEMNPFLVLDYAGPTRFEPSAQPRGVGEHPHAGFETITLVYQGELEHRDSGGHAGSLGPGDVQWMTAGAGLVHEEQHAEAFTREGGDLEVAQLWLNLPKAHKGAPPRYQNLTASGIPQVELGERAHGRVVAGTLTGVTGPAHTFTPVTLADLRLEAGARADFTLPEGHTAAIVLLRGSVVVNGESLKWQGGSAVLSPWDEGVHIEAAEDSLLLVLGGEPIHEPVAHYGPFVLNTPEELWQAFQDYREGKMGRLEPSGNCRVCMRSAT
ncbi:MAG: pirin family protein [Bryobacterales bacterium]|nr:pirin family protein [Bryobacterales bacterium]